MRTAILNRGMQRRRERQQQRAAPHAVAGICTHLAEHAYGTGQHARSAVVAGIAFDEQQAAPHLVANAVAGIAGHDHGAAFHALALARNRRGEKIAGIAVDVQQAAGQTAGGEDADIAMQRSISCISTSTANSSRWATSWVTCLHAVA